MDKVQRQARHLQRLELKRQRDEKMMEHADYWYRFEEKAIRNLRELPGQQREHPRSVSLFYWSSFENLIHRRLEWGDVSARQVQKIWMYEDDVPHFDVLQFPEIYGKDRDPAIQEDQQTISLDSLAELIATVSELRLPALPTTPSYICMDGVSFELTFTQDCAISVWKWHNTAPECWQPLENVVRLILSFDLEQQLR